MRGARLALLVLACVILVGGAPVVRGQETMGSWTIDYRTRALRVEAVEQSSTAVSPRLPDTYLVKVTLKNVSGRTITAIVVGIAPPTPGDSGLTQSVDMANTGGMQPEKTEVLLLTYRLPVNAERTIRVLAALFHDRGKDEGDAAVIESIRYTRLGKVAESIQFLSLLSQIDPLALDDSSIDALEASVKDTAHSLEEALSALSPSQQDRLHITARLRGAGPKAIEAFLSGYNYRRADFLDVARKLKELPRPFGMVAGKGSEKDRKSYVAFILKQYGRSADALESLCQRDLEVEQ